MFSLGRIFEENTPKVGGKQTIAILKTKRNMKTETDGRHRHISNIKVLNFKPITDKCQI